MITNEIQRVETMLKDELKKLAMGEPLGLAVTLAFAPIQLPTGQSVFALSWIVMVTKKSPLIGYDDIAFPIIIPIQNSMPNDTAFIESMKMSLENVRQIADESVNGPQPPIRGETMQLPRAK